MQDVQSSKGNFSISVKLLRASKQTKLKYEYIG